MLDNFRLSKWLVVGLLLLPFAAKAQIPYCSQPPAAPLTGSECVIVDQNSFLKSSTTGAIAALGGGGGSSGPVANSTNCQLVATANVVALSGLPFIDNINGVESQCIFLPHQSTGSQNGPWTISSGAWSRPAWYSSGSSIQAILNTTINISQGASYAGSQWALVAPSGTITIDSTATTWIRLPPPALASGSTTARTVDAIAGDTANPLAYGAYGNTIRKNYGNSPGSSGINCTAGLASVTLDGVTIPSAYNAAHALIPGCGNPGAVTGSNPGAGTISFNFSAAGTGAVPASTLTCSGGTATTACQVIVFSTQVVSATVAASGSGCANGTQTVTGTTGVSGTTAVAYFTASVNVSGNAITAVNSITTGGTYYVNPTTLTAEPVTGASCVGAQLSVVMGALTGAVTVAGNYTAVPSNPVGFTGTGSGIQATFGSGPYWYGNPLVGTISGVVNSGGNATFNMSSVAGSTSTNGLGKAYLWLNDDAPGIAAALASGKQAIILPSPPLVSGWEVGYTISSGLSMAAGHRWDFNCQGNFIAGANASAVSGAMLTANTGPAFRAQSNSIIHNCEFDATGNFARDLTIADWDWQVENNSFLNATSVNVAWNYGGHAREGFLRYFYIFNDGYNPLTLPNEGLDSEADDSWIDHGTIVGVQQCAINSGNYGDVHFSEIHAYSVNSGPSFCEGGTGDFWLETLADTPAPGFPAYKVTAGYNYFTQIQYQTGASWLGQQGILLTSTSNHNYIIGGALNSGNNTPTGFSCVDQTAGTQNTFDPAPYGCDGKANVITYPKLSGTSGISTWPASMVTNDCLSNNGTSLVWATCGTGSGSGTVNSGTIGQIAYYAASGTAVSGETLVPIASGGTNASTANAALNNLLPSQIGNSGDILTTNGTNTSWLTAPPVSFSTLTNGTNTTANALQVGSGASLGPVGTGTIIATSINSLTGIPAMASQTILGNGTGSTATPIALSLGANLVATASGIGTAQAINAQTGTTYTVLTTDAGKLLTFSNSGAIAVTLPVATSAGFTAGFSFDVEDLGLGSVTITPTTSTINGVATLVVATNLGCTITSDGTNYQVSACSAVAPSPGSTFNVITSGTNANTLTMGTGGTLTFSGTGVVNADDINGAVVPTSAAVLGTNSSKQLTAVTIANNTVLANVSGSTAGPTATSALSMLGLLNTPTCDAQTGTTYTLVLTDANTCVTMNNASSNTLTIPTNASVAFPVGTSITIEQLGAGITTISPAAGVTLESQQYGASSSISYALVGAYDFAQFRQTAANTWILAALGPGRGGPWIDVGTKFTLGSGTGTCATTSTLTGGASTGSFKCTGSSGASTQVVNLPTALNGWVCEGNDLTTTTDTVHQTVSTASSATLSGTIVANDVINFMCRGF